MSGNAPDKSQLNEIARQAERDLNTYQSKTGAGKGRVTGLDDYGVNAGIDRKFPGATVKAGEDLVTNASYDRPIPPDEGGDVDDKGRFVRGSAYEGAGGPEDKTAHVYQHNPGKIDEGVVKGWGKDPRELERAMLSRSAGTGSGGGGGGGGGENVLPAEQALGGRGREPVRHDEVLEQGRQAAKSNVGMAPDSRGEVPAQGSRGSNFKAAYYETPESVPDQAADQNEVPPETVVETSKNI